MCPFQCAIMCHQISFFIEVLEHLTDPSMYGSNTKLGLYKYVYRCIGSLLLLNQFRTNSQNVLYDFTRPLLIICHVTWRSL